MHLLRALVLLVLLSGCDSGQDSWALYKSDHLYNGGSPSVSPDGRSVVFSSPRSGRGDIYRLTRGRLTRLTRSNEFEAQPIYSPSGEKIAYERESDGWTHVWVMNADGSNQSQLTTGRAMDSLVGYSPDGKKIYFTRGMPSSGLGREGVDLVMDADGRNLRRQPPRPWPASVDEFPSADGTRIIAFGPYSRSKIRVLNSATREEVGRLETPAGELSSPVLSYDGKMIAFSLFEDGAEDVSVYVIRLDQLALQKLR
jgi:TolB protein